MSTTIPILNLIPQPISAPILPILPNELNPPSDVSAEYSASAKTLKVTATISVPKGIDPNTIVLYQYYDPTNLLELNFYFVYDMTNTTNEWVEYKCPFEASNVDFSGRVIKLASVTGITTMLKDADPKTSRGTMTTVHSIGGGHGHEHGGK